MLKGFLYRSWTLKCQISLPWKSKALKSPEPTKAKTYLPSVQGEEEASLPSSFLMTALTSRAIFCVHRILPSVETHQRTRSLLCEPVRKMRSPQMIGVDEPLPG